MTWGTWRQASGFGPQIGGVVNVPTASSTLWDPAQLGAAFYAGFRTMDTNGANAGAEVTTTTNVTQWNDWSGNARHVTNADADTGARFVYSATGLDGVKPGLLAGTGGSYLKRSPTTVIATGTRVQMFSVVKMVDSVWGAGTNAPVMFAGSSFHEDVADWGWTPLCQDAASSLLIRTWPGSIRASKTYVADTAMQVAGIVDATNETMYINGVAGTPVANGFPTSGSGLSHMGIGNVSGAGGLSQSASRSMYGSVLSEIVLITGDIISGNRQKVEGYLAHKWGLTAGLDSGHPYKSTPPYA